MGGHEGCGFCSPMLATTWNRVLASSTKTECTDTGGPAKDNPRLTNLPSRFHESHSLGVPFDICISGSSEKEVKEVHS